MWSHTLWLSTKRVKLITSPAKCYCFGLYRYGIVHTNKVAVAWYSRGGIHVFSLMLKLLFLLFFIFFMQNDAVSFSFTHSFAHSLYLYVCTYLYEICICIFMVLPFVRLTSRPFHQILNLEWMHNVFVFILFKRVCCSPHFLPNIFSILFIFSFHFIPLSSCV